MLSLLALGGCQVTYDNVLPRGGYAPSLRGFLYYHNTEPLDVHFAGTPVYHRLAEGEGDVKQVSVHYFPIYVDIVWDSNAIGDIAFHQGIDEIYYADMETLSVFFGFFSRRTVRIYGKPTPPKPVEPTPPATAPPEGK